MHRRDFVSLLPLGALAWRPSSAAEPPLSGRYRDVARRLIGAALVDEAGWHKIEYVCDRIGPRICGSAALERAVAWTAAGLQSEGLSGVRTIPVKVPHWVRGEESAEVVAPEHFRLAMLGLGGSVGTPAAGLTAEVVSVASFDELNALDAAKVRGRIVLYNVPYAGYGRTVQYRTAGAVAAARLGAVASLVRSVASASLRSPHTGVLRYDENVAKIPHAAISVEDAQRIQRLIDAGHQIKLCLKMGAQTLPDADSANVIGEIPGATLPQEVVVLGGHIDSWDVGTGAQDDASGFVACWQAVSLIHQLGLRAQRTIRFAAWVNEEQSGTGGEGYRAWVGDAVRNHVAAIEMDGGAERTIGFGLGLPRTTGDAVKARALTRLKEIGQLIAGICPAEMRLGGGGADIAPLMRDGVPGLGHHSSGEHYFDWHHSAADTLDKIDPRDFKTAVAALAVLSYVLADMPVRLDA